MDQSSFAKSNLRSSVLASALIFLVIGLEKFKLPLHHLNVPTLFGQDRKLKLSILGMIRIMTKRPTNHKIDLR